MEQSNSDIAEQLALAEAKRARKNACKMAKCKMADIIPYGAPYEDERSYNFRRAQSRRESCGKDWRNISPDLNGG